MKYSVIIFNIILLIGEEEIVKNITLEQNFKMESACGCPMYTNYTPSFKECLDYIFYQTDFISIIDVSIPQIFLKSSNTYLKFCSLYRYHQKQK